MEERSSRLPDGAYGDDEITPGAIKAFHREQYHADQAEALSSMAEEIAELGNLDELVATAQPHASVVRTAAELRAMAEALDR